MNDSPPPLQAIRDHFVKFEPGPAARQSLMLSITCGTRPHLAFVLTT